jgi:hypothetical protein
MPRYLVPIVVEVEADDYRSALNEAERVGKLNLGTPRTRYYSHLSADALPEALGLGADFKGQPRYLTGTHDTVDTGFENPLKNKG